ncbi:MAG: 50S ribosomal protein L25/general stress protein Ctc [Luteitalea sp.]|nr:50S ribosomal protein L25/general stress protein Ctc [Luteitalea sp.]
MEAILEAAKRETRGKNAAQRMRTAGQVPAVVYGAKLENVPVAVDATTLSRILHSESGVNTLIDLSLDGASAKVLVKDFQLDPVTRKILHADFFRVAMDKRLTISVPVVLKGDARGVKQQSGMLDFVTREIEVECFPGDIPEHIEIDVSEMVIGDGVRVGDLPRNDKWDAVSEAETMIVHVVPPHVEKAPEEEVAAEPAAAEPELIKKGKPEKEEE